tara:strand:+ start:187 stop:642 length:456 start_codon:yes stop_codon:yes gene_type:complete
MITPRHKSRNTHDDKLCVLTIEGEPASKANSRRLVLIKGRLVPIKSKKAIEYSKAFEKQCPTLDSLYEEDLAIAIKVIYKSRRPDLDESLVLDLLQGKIYKNDRLIKLKWIEWGLDKEHPRTLIVVGLLEQQREILNAFRRLVDEDTGRHT